MADVKISALPAVPVAVATTDLFAIVQGGVTYKATLTQVVAAFTSTGLTATAGVLTVNLSTGVAGGQSVIGGTAASNNLTLSSTSNATKGKILFGTSAYDEVNNRLGIGTAVPDRPLDVNGTARIQERLTVSQDNTVATQVVSVINTDTANCGMVIAPSGTGAIMATVPNGAASGGNLRGTNSIDWQIARTSATQVASGNYAVIGGGISNTASGTGATVAGGGSNTASGSDYATIAGGQLNTVSSAYSFIGGGFGNTASTNTYASVVGGQSNTASGQYSFVGGGESNIASVNYSSISGGYLALAYLYAQRANASGRFAANSDAQTSAITYRRSITGQAIQELFLNGSSERAILNISSPGPTNARAWRAQVDVVAIVATAGGGGLVINECFMGSYLAGIKRVGATTSLVGTVATVNEVSDTNMATAVVTIDADDTNEALRIQFTPPSTADGSTVIRVVATAYLTEVGR